MLRRHASRLGLLILMVSLYVGTAPAPSVPASSRPRPVQQRHTATRSETQAAALWLRQRVSRDCPAIDDPALDDWSRVCLLRQWAWQHIPWCSRSLLLDQKPAISLYCRDAPGVFAYLLSDSGGVWCGGAAYALAKLYELYGYQAWTYDYGLPEVMTHVTTVVRIQYHGQPMLVLQDPTFNLTYNAPNGMPLDLATLLKRLRLRQAASVVVQAGDPSQRRGFLVAPGDSAAEYWALASQPPHQLLWNGLWRYRCQFTQAGFVRAFGPAIGRALTARGWPTEPIYLMVFPQEVRAPELRARLAAAGLLPTGTSRAAR